MTNNSGSWLLKAPCFCCGNVRATVILVLSCLNHLSFLQSYNTTPTWVCNSKHTSETKGRANEVCICLETDNSAPKVFVNNLLNCFLFKVPHDMALLTTAYSADHSWRRQVYNPVHPVRQELRNFDSSFTGLEGTELQNMGKSLQRHMHIHI